jgi:hypothetical protein
MSSEKMNLDSFKGLLKEGQYDSRTGALRAIGRAGMPEAEKEKCRAAVHAHFPEASTEAKAPVKKAPSKKASKKVTKKAPSKKVTKKASKKAAKKAPAEPDPAPSEDEAIAPPPGVRVGRKKTSKKRRSSGTPAASRSEVRTGVTALLAQKSDESAEAYLDRMNNVIKTAREGMSALEFAKQQDASVTITDGIRSAATAISGSMTGLSVFAQQLAKGNFAQPEPSYAAEPPPPPPPVPVETPVAA